ncbi:hypothetical protein FQN54_001763 [Arachnomyces sp. PD_36]|nr:hypothetical protein FQN54_001763 [Arachnomyces sp. PD_36]
MARTRSQAVSPGSHVSLETDRAPRRKKTTTAAAVTPNDVPQNAAVKKSVPRRGPRKGRKANKADEMEVEKETNGDEASSNNNNQSEHNISSSTSEPMEGVESTDSSEHGESHGSGNSETGHTTSTSQDQDPPTAGPSTGLQKLERACSESERSARSRSRSESPKSRRRSKSPRSSPTPTRSRSPVSPKQFGSPPPHSEPEEEPVALDASSEDQTPPVGQEEPTGSAPAVITSLPTIVVTPPSPVLPQLDTTEEPSHISPISSPVVESPRVVSPPVVESSPVRVVSPVVESPTIPVAPQLEPAEEPSHISHVTPVSPPLATSPVVTPTTPVAPQSEPAEEPSHISHADCPVVSPVAISPVAPTTPVARQSQPTEEPSPNSHVDSAFAMDPQLSSPVDSSNSPAAPWLEPTEEPSHHHSPPDSPIAQWDQDISFDADAQLNLELLAYEEMMAGTPPDPPSPGAQLEAEMWQHFEDFAQEEFNRILSTPVSTPTSGPAQAQQASASSTSLSGPVNAGSASGSSTSPSGPAQAQQASAVSTSLLAPVQPGSVSGPSTSPSGSAQPAWVVAALNSSSNPSVPTVYGPIPPLSRAVPEIRPMSPEPFFEPVVPHPDFPELPGTFNLAGTSQRYLSDLYEFQVQPMSVPTEVRPVRFPSTVRFPTEASLVQNRFSSNPTLSGDVSMEDVVIPQPTDFELAFPDFTPLRHRQLFRVDERLSYYHPNPSVDYIRERETEIRNWVLEHPPQAEPQQDIEQAAPSSPAQSDSTDGEDYIARLYAILDDPERESRQDSLTNGSQGQVGTTPLGEADSHMSTPNPPDQENSVALVQHPTPLPDQPEVQAQPTVIESQAAPLPVSPEVDVQPAVIESQVAPLSNLPEIEAQPAAIESHVAPLSILPEVEVQPTVIQSDITPLISATEGSTTAQESVNPTPQISYTPVTVSEDPPPQSSISFQPVTLDAPQDSVHGHISAGLTVPPVSRSAVELFQHAFLAAQPVSGSRTRPLFPPPVAENSQRTTIPGLTLLEQPRNTSMATQTSPGRFDPSFEPRQAASVGTQTSPLEFGQSPSYCKHCTALLCCPNGHSADPFSGSSHRQVVPATPQALPEASSSRQATTITPPRQALPETSPGQVELETPRRYLPVSTRQATPYPPKQAPAEARRKRTKSKGKGKEPQLTQEPVAPRKKRARDQSTRDQADDSTVRTRPQKRQATDTSSTATTGGISRIRRPLSANQQTFTGRQLPPSAVRLFKRNVSYAETRRRLAAERQGRVHTSTMFRLPALIAQNDADRRAAEAAEAQNLAGPPLSGVHEFMQQPVETSVQPPVQPPVQPVVQPVMQPAEQENSTQASNEPVVATTPTTPQTGSGWGLRSFVTRFIPRFGSVREQSISDAVHVSPTDVSPERTSVRTSPAGVSSVTAPSQQGDGAAQPRPPQMDVGARPQTVTPLGQQERKQNPPDLTYSLFSKPIDRDRYLPKKSSVENGVANAVAGPSCQTPTEGDKPKSLKKRKRSSLKEIPNPVGCSYGMDLDYFCYSSESEEEGDEEHEDTGKTSPKGISRSPKPAAKRVRFDKSPMDTPSRLRAAASVPGPHGQTKVTVEAEPKSPAPVANPSGTYCVEYSDSDASPSSGSPTPPPPSDVARGKQRATEVAPEPQPSLSGPLLLPSPAPIEPTAPLASIPKPHHTLPTLSGGEDSGLPRVEETPTAWDLESRVWDEEMAVDDEFSRDALWMYQQAPTGDLSQLPWPSEDRHPDTVVDRLVGEEWNERHALASFEHFCRDFERFRDVGEV